MPTIWTTETKEETDWRHVVPHRSYPYDDPDIPFDSPAYMYDYSVSNQLNEDNPTDWYPQVHGGRSYAYSDPDIPYSSSIFTYNYTERQPDNRMNDKQITPWSND